MGRFPNRRDLASFAFAAIGTLFTTLSGPSPQLVEDAPVTASEDPALDDFIDIEHAKREGSWWLDENEVDASLSFAPQHDRLVWRVGTNQHRVLLDAQTGEALEFEY